MSLVHSERTKLLATALNDIAAATVVTAIVAPRHRSGASAPRPRAQYRLSVV